jgi:hypothetical protein
MTIWMEFSCRNQKRTVLVMQMNSKPRVTDARASSSNVEDNEVEAVNYYPENGMQVDRGFVSSSGLLGIKDTTKADEIIDPSLRKTNKDLRRARNIEKEL